MQCWIRTLTGSHLKHAVLDADPEGLPGLLQLQVGQVSLPLQAIIPLLLLQQLTLQLRCVLLLLLQLSMHCSSLLMFTCSVLQLCSETAACLFQCGPAESMLCVSVPVL